MEVIDNVLESNEISSLIADLNRLKNYTPCPHTDELLPIRFDSEGNSINILKPRVNCYGNQHAATAAYNSDWKKVTTDHENQLVKNIIKDRNLPNRIHSKAHHGQWLTKKHLPKSVLKIISYANIDYTGVEWWCYDSTKYPIKDTSVGVGKHIDADGGLQILTGKVYPACASVVYYHEVDDLNGGDLRSFKPDELALSDRFEAMLPPSDQYDDESNITSVVAPKPNRAVVIPSGVEHDVTPFKGRRVGFVFLLWQHRPIEFL
jgi:hypothetical protein